MSVTMFLRPPGINGPPKLIKTFISSSLIMSHKILEALATLPDPKTPDWSNCPINSDTFMSFFTFNWLTLSI